MSQIVFDFSDRRFVVTGASSGIGRQIALELAESGAMVLAIARREEKLRELQQEAAGIEYAACDVADTEAVEKSVAEFTEIYGKLRGCVHAAGISAITPLKMYDQSLAKRVMEVSFWNGLDLVRVCTKRRYAEDGSSCILFSSVCAYSGEKGMFAYAGTKAAVLAGAKSVAKEIALKEHRINVIAPGWIDTDMTQKAGKFTHLEDFYGRHLLGKGRPEDVSGAVLFMLSDRAKWITGTSVIVDGGYLA